MNLRAFAAALLATMLLTAPLSQTSAQDRNKRADEILKKIRQLDLSDQILPVLLTKDQYSKLLPAIEKARQTVREQEKAEYENLSKLEPKIDEALKEAFDEGKVPPVETMAAYARTFKFMRDTRNVIAELNTNNVLEVIEPTLDPGQRKAIANALKPQMYDGSIDPQSLDEKTKMKFWVKVVLLDPQAYDVLVRLSKRAK